MGEELNQNLFVDDQGALSAGSDNEIYVWAGSKKGTEKTQIFLQILFPIKPHILHPWANTRDNPKERGTQIVHPQIQLRDCNSKQ
jgi:hypothetical protein